MSDCVAELYKCIEKSDPLPKVLSNKILTNFTSGKLLSYQIPHVVNLVKKLAIEKIVLDASDTGVGKTYAACAVCKELGRRPIIVCPITLIYNWKNVLDYFGIKAYDIVNYETLRNAKTYKDDKYKTRIGCPYLEIIDPDPDDPLKCIYKWNVPKNSIVIFDEAHSCKTPKRFNGKLLISTKQLIDKKIPVLLLSATICEKFVDMAIPFLLFGLIQNIRSYKSYIRKLKTEYPQYRVRRRDFKSSTEYKNACDNANAMIIYETVKSNVCRIKIKDLGDKFPSNQVCCQQFFAEDSDKIAEAYREIAIQMKELRDNPGGNHLAMIQKLKQEIELRKIPIFIEQANLYLEEGKSVIIFVNFLKTIEIISEQLFVKCIIRGGQNMEERQNAIDMFQSNQEKIIICQVRAGGVGIGLHDIHGNHPRAVLLNYPDSASVLLQALGRAPRSGALTPVLQRIIFVANVDYEKKIMFNINRKLTNISAINDGDLEGYKYAIRKITRQKIEKRRAIEI